MWGYVGGTRMSEVASEFETICGFDPFQFMGDYTMGPESPSTQPAMG